MTLLKVSPPLQQDVDLSQTYDAVIVGSGAAGGMAAHVLTAQGLRVLMLEAGKKLPIEQELRSMEWPYDHPRRGDAPPGSHGLSFNEYTIRKPPYAKGTAFKHVYSYVGGWSGSDYVKNILVDEKDHPYTGTNYAWVRARCLGGKTNIWGRLALRLSDYDFKAKSHDGYGEDWPISYTDLAPYFDKVEVDLVVIGRQVRVGDGPILAVAVMGFGLEVVVGQAEGQAAPDVGLAPQAADPHPGVTGAGVGVLFLVHQDVLDVVRAPPSADVRVHVLESRALGVGRLADRVLVEGEVVRSRWGVAAARVIVRPLHRAQLLLDGQLLPGLEHEHLQAVGGEHVRGHPTRRAGAHDHRIVCLREVDVLLDRRGDLDERHRYTPPYFGCCTVRK